MLDRDARLNAGSAVLASFDDDRRAAKSGHCDVPHRERVLRRRRVRVELRHQGTGDRDAFVKVTMRRRISLIDAGSNYADWTTAHLERRFVGQDDDRLAVPLGDADLLFRQAWETIREWEQSPEFDLVTVLDDQYPVALRDIHQMPPMLFVKGELRADENGVSVVGTRKPTERGRSIAAKRLADRGISVISGLAIGIDGTGPGGWNCSHNSIAEPSIETSDAIVDHAVLPWRSPRNFGRSSIRASNAARSSRVSLTCRSLEPLRGFTSASIRFRQRRPALTPFPQLVKG